MGKFSLALTGNKVWILIVAGILSFQAALVLMHEPWLDEWQSLQLSVQSPTVGQLFENLHYEGHPPLYYLILRGAARIVPLPWVLVFVQLPVSLLIQSIILFKSFPQRYIRVLFSLSAFVIIDYGIIARSLSVGVLLFLIAWAFRKKRWAWVAIIALPSVDFLFGVLSLVCLVIYWQERNWSWPGFAFWMVSALAAALSVVPAPDVAPALPPSSNLIITAFVFLAYISQLLLPLPISENGLAWNTTFPVVISVVGGFIAIVFCYLNQPKIQYHKILLICFLLICFIFSLFVYVLPIRHLSIIALLFIALIWREQEMGLVVSRYFSAWLGMSAICGIFLGIVNLIYPFDTAAEAARWIRQSGLTHKHWVSYPDSRAQGIAMLNNMQFTRIGKVCQQDFIRWDNEYSPKNPVDAIRDIEKLVDKYGRLYLVSDKDIRIFRVYNKKIAFFKSGFNGQKYYFYELGHIAPRLESFPEECQTGRFRFAAWSLQEQDIRHNIRQRLRKFLGVNQS